MSTKALAPEDRGLIVTVVALTTLLGAVGGLGTGSALRAALPTEIGTGLLARYLRLSTALALFAGLTGAGVTWTFLRVAIPAEASGVVTVLGGAATALAVANTQVVEGFFSLGRFSSGSLFASGGSVGGFAGTLVGLHVEDSARAVLAGASLGAAPALLIGSVLLFRLSTEQEPLPDGTRSQNLILAGLPTLGWTLGLAIVLRLDRLLLAAVAGSRTVAVYGLAVTLAEGCRLVPMALGQLQTHASAQSGSLAGLRRSAGLALLATSLAGGLVWITGAVLIPVLFEGVYGDAVPLLGILLIGELGYAWFVVSCRGLIGVGAMREIGVIGIGFAAIALPGYWIAASVWGASGCAGAGSLIYILMAIVGDRVATKRAREERVGVAA